MGTRLAPGVSPGICVLRRAHPAERTGFPSSCIIFAYLKPDTLLNKANARIKNLLSYATGLQDSRNSDHELARLPTASFIQSNEGPADGDQST